MTTQNPDQVAWAAPGLSPAPKACAARVWTAMATPPRTSRNTMTNQ